jgi:hypothetical protein
MQCFLVSFFVLFYSVVCSAGTGTTLNGWDVRAGTSDSGYVRGDIRKGKRLGDVNSGSRNVTFTIVQDYQNEVHFYSFYDTPNDCSTSETDIRDKVVINGKSIWFDIFKESDGCEVYIAWYAEGGSAREYVRSAFNSGALKFKNSGFEVVFDTSEHLLAYQQMQMEVKQVKKESKISLNYEIFGLDYMDEKLASVLYELDEVHGLSRVASIGFLEGERSAATAIGAGDKSPLIFHASIIGDGNDVGFAFKEPSDCELPGELTTGSITVNDQKLQTIKLCVSNKSSPTSWSANIIKTVQGKKFVHRQLSNHAVLYVSFEDFVLPFLSEGFTRAYDDAANPGL